MNTVIRQYLHNLRVDILRYNICYGFIVYVLDKVIQPVINYFKHDYTINTQIVTNLITDNNWSPYQSKKFITPVSLVHDNPMANNVHARVSLHDGVHVSDECVINSQEFWMIFKTHSCTFNAVPKTILIEGAPGMGKTVIAEEIAYRWAKNKMLRNMQLVLLVYLRNVDIQKITDFDKLLQYYYADKHTASICAKHFISNQGKNLMIIFDGFEEMAVDKQQKNDTLFMNLLMRKILPDCYLVVTSRLYITSHIRHYFDCKIEILGFTKDDCLSYLQESLSSEKLKLVTEIFQSSSIINDLCYIPINLMNFLFLVEYDHVQLPKTQTELTAYAIYLIIEHNKRKFTDESLHVSIFQNMEIDNIIVSVAPFTYKMLEREQLVFLETEIKSAGIYVEHNDDHYELLKAVQLNSFQNLKHKRFVHPSVQEYLIAYYLSKNSDIAQKFAVNHKFWDGRYFTIWKMYLGLTKGDNFPLKTFLSGETTGMHHLLGYTFPGISEELKMSKVRCLQLFEILLEAPDSEMKESLSSVVKTDLINLSNENLNVTEVDIISHYIVRSHVTMEWQMIDLSHCNIDDAGLQLLYQLSNLEDGRTKPTISCLNISHNKICKLSTLFHLISACKINRLLASNNMCEDNDCVDIKMNFGSLTELDISSNQLGNKDVVAVCKALCNHQNLRKLNIDNNYVDENISNHLITSILQWDNFAKLECKGDHFQDYSSCVKLIQFAIQQAKFHDKTINFDGEFNHICYFLVLLECMNDISLHQSNFATAISEVTELSLDCRDMPEQSIPPTLNVEASQSFKLFANLVTLNISGICISDNVANALVVAFSSTLLSLKKLLMNNCNLNSNIVIKFMDSLKYAKFISTVQMSNNFIDNEATEAFVVAFLHWNLRSIKNIDLGNNPINLKMFHFIDSLVIESFEDLCIDFSDDIEKVINFIKLINYMSNVSLNNSTFINALTRIDTLNLNCISESGTHGQILLTAQMSTVLKRFEHLTTFNISGICIDKESVDVLADAFASHLKSLQYLVLNGCGLDSKSTIKLVKNLHQAKNMQEIQLCNNVIDDEATEELIIAILHWNSFKVIKLEDNPLAEESIFGIKFLFYLNSNILFNKGVIDLESKPQNLKPFTTLLHCMNKVEPERSNYVSSFIQMNSLFMGLCASDKKKFQLTVYGSVFFQKFVSLVTLRISCVVISEGSADMLSVAFGSNLLSLKQLYMSNCCITSKTAIKFVQQLQKNKNLEVLDFSNNLIDDEATEALVTAAFHWKDALFLSKNKFSVAIKDLFNLLSLCKLEGIRCHCNSGLFINILEYAKGVPVMSVGSLLDQISKFQNLDLFYINGKEVLELTVDASQFFLRFVNLTSLHISNIAIPKYSMTVLAEAFASNLKCLKQLTLYQCDMTSEIAIILMSKLKKTVDLKELVLCNNHMDDKATESIATAIFCWHSLKVISLDGNLFSSKSIELFKFITTEILKSSGLSIDISDNITKVELMITLLGYARDTMSLGYISNLKQFCIGCFQKPITDKQLELTLNAAKYFQQFTSLIKLDISRIIISKQVSNLLAVAFGSNLKTLECLIMNGCNLTSPIVRKLIKELQNAENIKEIQLCDNFMNDNVIETLAIAILNWNALKVLKVDSNKFSDHYKIQMLFSILLGKEESHNLTLLFESTFYITKAFISVLDYANHHTGKRVLHFTNAITKITTLNLNSTLLDKPLDLELTVGAANFFSNFTHIVNLNLSGIVLNEESVNALCKSFNFSKLQSIQLNNCRLTSKCIINLLDRLKFVDIQVFRIEDNSIDDDATKALVIAILHWSTPCTIALERNRFSQNFHSLFQLVMKFLKFSQNILSFSGNLDDTSSFITLLECIKEVSIKHSKFLYNISKAESLYFHCSNKIYLCSDFCNVQEEPVDNLDEPLKLSSDASEFFQIFHNLTKLIIDGIIMSEITADNVLRTFSNNSHTLQHITLNWCSINSKIAIKFAGELQKAPNVTEFQLHNNAIDDEATEALVTMILHWNSLSIIGISKNHFSDKSINLFLFVKKNCLTDKSNSIDCKHKDTASMLALLGIMENVSTTKSKLVKSITCVNQLALNCSGDEQQMTMHTSLFFKRFTNLKELSLSGITIDIKSMDIIASALVSNLYGTLESLMFNSCHLSSVSVAIVFASVNKSKIRSLCLSNNDITNEVTGAINEFLDNNTILQFISLANNHLTTEIFLNIKENMLRCISLQYIDISNNQITDDAAKDLAHLSSHFKSLKVDGNQLSDNTFKQCRT